MDEWGHSTPALLAAANICEQVGGQLRLVHVRQWDPNLPKYGNRFYTETSHEATMVLATQVDRAWK